MEKIYMLNYDQDQYRTAQYWEKFYFKSLDTLYEKLEEVLEQDGFNMNIVQPYNPWIYIQWIWQYWVESEWNDDFYFEISEIKVN